MEEPSGVWEAAPAACAAVICIASFIGSTNGLEFERHREVSPVSGEVMLSRGGNATCICPITGQHSSDLIFSPVGPTTTSRRLCLAGIKYALEMNIIQRRRRETAMRVSPEKSSRLWLRRYREIGPILSVLNVRLSN